jgi:hypothetical protein
MRGRRLKDLLLLCDLNEDRKIGDIVKTLRAK